jgi:hypothetical protein
MSRGREISKMNPAKILLRMHHTAKKPIITKVTTLARDTQIVPIPTPQMNATTYTTTVKRNTVTIFFARNALWGFMAPLLTRPVKNELIIARNTTPTRSTAAVAMN